MNPYKYMVECNARISRKCVKVLERTTNRKRVVCYYCKKEMQNRYAKARYHKNRPAAHD